MATTKQKLALIKTVENGGNITKAMREVGYSERTINNPSNLTKSKGYRDILKDSGLSDTLIVSSLVEDIKNKPQDRTRELYLAMKLLGMEGKALDTRNSAGLNINLINFREMIDQQPHEIVAQDNETD